MQKLNYKFDELDPQEILRIKAQLERVGMLSEFMGGIQLDIMVAKAKIHDMLRDSGYCDHNCRTETNGEHTGSYNCNMAKSSRPGPMSVKSLASSTDILFGLSNAVEGLKVFNFDLTHSYIAQIAEVAELTPEEVAAYLISLKQNRIVLNIFGGNPELHPQLFEIIEGAEHLGLHVNLTTTGGMFMVGKFAEKFLASPTDIALSADDFNGPNHIFKLRDALEDPAAYKATWLAIGPQYGQQRKALEAVYAAHVITEDQRNKDVKTKILFNLVIHPGNISYVNQLIDSILQVFPNAEVNPFPAQDAFYNGEPSFTHEDLPLWEEIIDSMIRFTLEDRPGIIKKLHYWLLLKSAFNVYRGNPQQLVEFLSGMGAWTCYSEIPGAGRFLQIGASPEITTLEKAEHAGGHLNCFWNNETIYNTRGQVATLTPAQVNNHIAQGIHDSALNAENACGGCLFPRLNALDELVLIAGMNPELHAEYVALRQSILY